jgi:NSS family neurotransmitter:Na+ symporter
MSTKRASIHGLWSGQLAFILAATGSAVGLSNIWKFPYIIGENGGGAFVLVYLVCILLIGIPVMMAEVMLGRRGSFSPVNTMRVLAIEEHASARWTWLGGAGVLAGFLILSYYSVIAGWAMAYVFRAGSGLFTGLTADGIQTIFDNLIAGPERLLAWHTLFMVMTTAVAARGVTHGLQYAVRLLIPVLFLLLLALLGYAWHSGSFAQGVDYMFHIDFSRITPEAVLVAMGQAFFTLSLGKGAVMAYGSYLPGDVSIARASLAVATLDTLVALLAGIAVFSILQANGLEPGSGPRLIFQSLPLAFGHMAYGALFGTLFFVLLVIAAWSSSIALIEPVVAWLVEQRGMTRLRAAIAAGAAAWAVGLLTIFSFNIWSGFRPLSRFTVFRDSTLFDLLDYLTANVMLPLTGLLIAVFAAWIMSRESSADELGMGDRFFYPLWRMLIRYITPLCIIVIFLHALGMIPFT